MNADTNTLVILFTDDALYRTVRKGLRGKVSRHHFGLFPGWRCDFNTGRIVYGALLTPHRDMVYDAMAMLTEVVTSDAYWFVGGGSSFDENLYAGDVAGVAQSKLINRPAPALNLKAGESHPAEPENHYSYERARTWADKANGDLTELIQPTAKTVNAVDMPDGPEHKYLRLQAAQEHGFSAIVPGISGFSDASAEFGFPGLAIAVIVDDLKSEKIDRSGVLRASRFLLNNIEGYSCLL